MEARVGLDLREIRPVHSGGLRVFLRELLHALVRMWPEGRFHVFQTEGDAPLLAEHPGRVAVEPIAVAEPRGTVDARAVALGLDVLFRGFPAGFHGFPPRRQLVLVTDLQHEALPELFAPEVLHDRRRRFDAALSHAGALAVPSEFSRRAIAAHPETRCAELVVVPGAAPRAATPSRPAAPGEATPYFLFPANLWPHKNHRRLFQAFRSFLERTRGPVELRLTGDARGWETLAPDIAGLPVRHLGYVSEHDLAILYRDALALVFLTLYEGFGLPILEAFHHGVPVLGSDRGSLPEIGGEAMSTCDPTDVAAMAEGLARIATDHALRSRLVRRGAEPARGLLVGPLGPDAARGPRATGRGAGGRARHAGPCPRGVGDHRVDGRPRPGPVGRRERDQARQDLPARRLRGDRRDGRRRARAGAAIRALLGPGDRLVSGATRNGAALADQGARLARGRILFFTEGHCELGPDTVGELIAFFDQGEYDAACVSATGRSASTFARMEQRVFDEHFQAWREPGDWRKVLFRGFAVLRRVYQDAGGFESRYGLFADRALAATLHAARLPDRLGRAGDRRPRQRPALPGAAGEHRRLRRPASWPTARRTTPGTARATSASPPSGPSGRTARGRRNACRCGRSPRHWPPPRSRSRARRSTSWAGPCSGAPGREHAAAPASPGPACAIGPSRERASAAYRAYAALWVWTARLAAADYLAAAGPPALPAVPAGDVSVADLDRYRSFGFHAVERLGDRPFRWTGRLAGIRLALPPGRHHVTLHTEPLRPPGAVSVCWNGRRLRAVDRRDREISFDVTAPPDAGSPQSLVLLIEPVRRRDLSPGERRQLGLPLFGLRLGGSPS